MKQIGSVEILRFRVYSDTDGSDVAVQPGIFPLMREGDRVWWPMRGRVSAWEAPTVVTERIGDGLFTMRATGGDEMSDEERSITSPTWTPEGFAELLRDPTFADGPEQRIRVRLFAGALDAAVSA